LTFLLSKNFLKFFFWDCDSLLFSFANRLTHIKENYKFQKDGKEGHRVEDGFRHIISEIKEEHSLKYVKILLVFLYMLIASVLASSNLHFGDMLLCRYVYVWHAITGYWGGVRPDVAEMEPYESKLTYPKTSPGVQSNEDVEYPDNSLDTIMKNGLGLVNPDKVFNFYDELHSYLASAGINGVKVDVQNILETLGAGNGGRVSLARKYHRALEASIARNFPDNGIISCMSHNTDGLYR